MFERELTLLLQQVDRERPHVRRRRGTFKRSKLRARDGGERISMPLGRGRGSGTPVCHWLWVWGVWSSLSAGRFGIGVGCWWKAGIGRGLFFSCGRVLTGIFACPAASGCLPVVLLKVLRTRGWGRPACTVN